MNVKKLLFRGLLAVLVTIGIVIVVVIVVFLRDRNRILAARPQLRAMAATTRGPVEYAEVGRGHLSKRREWKPKMLAFLTQHSE